MLSLFDLLFPKRCVGCNSTRTYLCEQCIQKISQSELVCPFCERLALGGRVHPVCKRKMGLDGLWFLGVYTFPLKESIKKLKYRRIEEFAKVLIDLMVTYWAKNTPQFLDELKKTGGEGWIITAVPLHRRRQNWRGFNQSELLSKNLSKRLGIEHQELLLRVKNTQPQAQLKSADRRLNIKNAFTLKQKKSLTNYQILLIDDVWTTGATLRECATTLKRAGAKSVWAITIAR